MGIENIKVAIIALIKLGKALDGALDDGKITLFEWFGLIPELKDVYLAFKNIDDLIQEYEDLDDQEYNELIQYVTNELDLQNQNTEEIIEASFEFATHLDAFIRVLRK